MYNQKKMKTGKIPSISQKIIKDHFEDRLDNVTAHVIRRYGDMRDHRKRYERNRDKFTIQYNAEFEPYNQAYRSSSKVPLARALTESYMGYAINKKPEFRFQCDENKHLARLYKQIWEKDRTENKRTNEILNDEYRCAIYGTSILYTGISQSVTYQYNIKKNATIDDFVKGTAYEDAEPTYKTLVNMKSVELRDFYLDNTAVEGVEDADDCILIKEVSEDAFMERTRENPLYFNLDKIKGQFRDATDKPYSTKEDNNVTANIVKIKMYRNVRKDVYIETANDIVVSILPIMDTIQGYKSLPFTMRRFGRKLGGYYGIGYCEACLMFQSEINNFREMTLDQMRKTGSDILIFGDNAYFENEDLVYGNYIKRISGSLDDNNFRHIKATPVDPNIANYGDSILNSMGAYIGAGIHNQVDGSITAFQTQVQEETNQKRINLVFVNRDIAYERLADLHTENIVKYYNLETDEEKKVIYTENEVRDRAEKKFFSRKNSGKNKVQIAGADLEGNISVETFTNLTAPTISSVDRQQKKEALTDIGNIIQSFALAKQSGFDIETFMDTKETIRDLLASYNISTDEEKDDKEEVRKAVDDLRNKLLQMGGMGQVGQLQPPQGQGQQPPQQQLSPLSMMQ